MCSFVLFCRYILESACSAGDPGLIPGQKNPLENGMVTHSSILAWTIPWTEEPDGLQSIGSQSWTRLKQLYVQNNQTICPSQIEPHHLHSKGCASCRDCSLSVLSSHPLPAQGSVETSNALFPTPSPYC